MSTEVNYISSVCLMGGKLLLNLSASRAALIYNFTWGIKKKLKSLMETEGKQSVSARHKRINSFPLVQIIIILLA